MDECSRPVVEYPTRVPLKVIGHGHLMCPEAITGLIQQHLGPHPDHDQPPTRQARGPYTSYTFWVTLPDAEAERPLREAIHRLPGVLMQL